MEQRAVIRFFTVNGFYACVVAAELQPVYETEALALPPVKKGAQVLRDWRTSLWDDPSSGRPLASDLIEIIASMLKKKPVLFISSSLISQPLY
jgi:hypothetical protein